jgi:hypothetical protein
LFCQEIRLNLDENADKHDDFLKQLEGVYKILSDINPDSVDLFDSKFISLKKSIVCINRSFSKFFWVFLCTIEENRLFKFEIHVFKKRVKLQIASDSTS